MNLSNSNPYGRMAVSFFTPRENARGDGPEICQAFGKAEWCLFLSYDGLNCNLKIEKSQEGSRRGPGSRVEGPKPEGHRKGRGSRARRALKGARSPPSRPSALDPFPCYHPRAISYSMKGTDMPKLNVEGVGEFEVPAGKRLVLALEDEAGIDQLHACGGQARCTTCRVEFIEGEPAKMTVAEKNVLAAKGLSGVRLSCQIQCDQDMTVRANSRLAGSGRADAGKRPADEIQPQPVEWT